MQQKNTAYRFCLLNLVKRSSYTKNQNLRISKLFKLDAGYLDKSKILGIDLVDVFTGISLLTNIGFSQQEAEKIRKLDLEINTNGLIAKDSDALKFREYADKIINEHRFTVVYVISFQQLSL